jgi:hypothetical protein
VGHCTPSNLAHAPAVTLEPAGSEARASVGPASESGLKACATMSSLAHLLSNIEKLPLPIWGSMFPSWNPTGVFPRSVTPTSRTSSRSSCLLLPLNSTVISTSFGVVNEGGPGAAPGPTWPGPLGPQRPKIRSLSCRCIRPASSGSVSRTGRYVNRICFTVTSRPCQCGGEAPRPTTLVSRVVWPRASGPDSDRRSCGKS